MLFADRLAVGADRQQPATVDGHHVLVGLEAIWGQRTDNDGRSGNDSRFQFSVKYSFSRQFEL